MWSCGATFRAGLMGYFAVQGANMHMIVWTLGPLDPWESTVCGELTFLCQKHESTAQGKMFHDVSLDVAALQ